MPPSSSQWFWSVSQWPDAIETLAREAKLAPIMETANLPKLQQADMPLNAQNVELAATYLGVESEPIQATYSDIDEVLRFEGPMLLATSALASDEPELLLVLSSQGQRICIITPTLSKVWVSLRHLRNRVCEATETQAIRALDGILDKAALPPKQRDRVCQKLLHAQLNKTEVCYGWQLRLLPNSTLVQQASEFGVPRLIAILLIAIGLVQASIVGAWVMLGQSLLSGDELNIAEVSLRTASLGAWFILLIFGLGFQLLSYNASGRIAALLSSAYRRTLLYGALKLHPNEIRHQGAGEFLSRTIDADAIQQGTLWGAFEVVWASSQIISAFAILLASDSSLISTGLLLGIFTLQMTAAIGYWRDSGIWQNSLRHITNRMVENMVGYRTRIAQQAPTRWHDEEYRDAENYYRFSKKQATFRTVLNGLTHLWVVFGIAGLIFSFNQHTLSQTEIAIRLGAILLALQGLSGMEKQIIAFVRIQRSWDQVKPIFSAAQRLPEKGLAALFAQRRRHKSDKPQTLLSAHNLCFRYAGRGRLALNNINLHINSGEHLLIEGPSGGGKSTLASVLAGLNMPESGLLLLNGFDRASMGLSIWRKSVVMVPQFHENHVFFGTFSFNLLMGRRWPPTHSDEQDAIEICAELGLDHLINRMPSGMQQIVGESGWQLSHGERSRLYIARALLQKADILILDESFGALDPENMARAMQCVLQRAPTMLVIAHP